MKEQKEDLERNGSEPMGKQELTVKGTMDLHRAVSYLEDLVASIKAGAVFVQQGDKVIALKPKKVVDVEVEVSQKKGKEKFVLELTWRTEEVAETTKDDLKISSVEPPQRAAVEHVSE